MNPPLPLPIVKPLPQRALPRERAPLRPQKGQMWIKPEAPLSEEPMSPNEVVRLHLDTILLRSVDETLEDIGKSLTPVPLTGLQIRHAMSKDKELKARWDAVQEHKAHHMFELAVSQAVKCGKAGDHGKASDLMAKLAGVMLPKVYGPRAELRVTGVIDLGVSGEVEVKMTPDEAYMKMVKGQ